MTEFGKLSIPRRECFAKAKHSFVVQNNNTEK